MLLGVRVGTKNFYQHFPEDFCSNFGTNQSLGKFCCAVTQEFLSFCHGTSVSKSNETFGLTFCPRSKKFHCFSLWHGSDIFVFVVGTTAEDKDAFVSEDLEGWTSTANHFLVKLFKVPL